LSKNERPDEVRLSEHFLLSDFMGCNSVYSKGYPNVFSGGSTAMKEGVTLCQRILEPLLAYSRLSISYGYISPSLSRLIVKYQDPDKPSYHRWDHGAACDVVLHDIEDPPALSAFWIDKNLPVSRTITYSESPFICVASRASEIDIGDPRRALYENRYVGTTKPKYISYSSSPTTRKRQKEEFKLDFDWRGGGYPSYHGGGTRQAQHVRTSKFTVLSDFLYSDAVSVGACNVLPEEKVGMAALAGTVYDMLLHATGCRRLSIVRGYESPEWKSSVHNWEKDVYLVVVPPASVEPSLVVDAANALPFVRAKHIKGTRRVGLVCQSA